MSEPDNATPLSHVLDTLSQGIFWKDLDSVYLGCNTIFAKAVGLNHRSEILGKTDADLNCTPAEVASFRADDLEVIETGRPKQFVLESQRQPDGETFWVETTKAPLRDEAGGIIGVVGLISDVTAYYRQSKDLLQTQNMLQSVLDTIPARVFWKDLDGVFLGCNRLLAVDGGLDSPEQIIGKTDYDFGWAEQAELYRADDAAVVKSGEPKIGYEEPQTTPDGKQIWLRTSKIPLREPNGEIIGVLGTYEDITSAKQAEAEQRRLEAQVQHAQKLESLGILAGGIAHDFNNLLVAVLGNADLALRQIAAVDQRLPERGGYQDRGHARPRSDQPDARLFGQGTFRGQQPATRGRGPGDGPVARSGHPQEGEPALRTGRQPAHRGGRRDADPPGGDEPGHQRRRGHGRRGRPDHPDHGPPARRRSRPEDPRSAAGSAGRRLRLSRSVGHRLRHGLRDAGTSFRAVLHHEVPGTRPGPGRGAGHRPRPSRDHQGLQRAGPGYLVQGAAARLGRHGAEARPGFAGANRSAGAVARNRPRGRRREACAGRRRRHAAEPSVSKS